MHSGICTSERWRLWVHLCQMLFYSRQKAELTPLSRLQHYRRFYSSYANIAVRKFWDFSFTWNDRRRVSWKGLAWSSFGLWVVFAPLWPLFQNFASFILMHQSTGNRDLISFWMLPEDKTTKPNHEIREPQFSLLVIRLRSNCWSTSHYTTSTKMPEFADIWSPHV